MALRRDGYRCVICRSDVSGVGAARVDHIKPVSTHPHLALDLDNLRTLCVLHDQQSHREKRSGSPTRQQRFSGCDVSGMPLDPSHSWSDSGPVKK
jgi:5-methylcytosine-specific restriction endonuclease McrA